MNINNSKYLQISTRISIISNLHNSLAARLLSRRVAALRVCVGLLGFGGCGQGSGLWGMRYVL